MSTETEQKYIEEGSKSVKKSYGLPTFITKHHDNHFHGWSSFSIKTTELKKPCKPFRESKNSWEWEWKGPLKIVLSNYPFEAEPAKVGCLGLLPVVFRVSQEQKPQRPSGQPVSNTVTVKKK